MIKLREKQNTIMNDLKNFFPVNLFCEIFAGRKDSETTKCKAECAQLNVTTILGKKFPTYFGRWFLSHERSPNNIIAIKNHKNIFKTPHFSFLYKEENFLFSKNWKCCFSTIFWRYSLKSQVINSLNFLVAEKGKSLLNKFINLNDEYRIKLSTSVLVILRENVNYFII